jgi:hypothetical protein
MGGKCVIYAIMGAKGIEIITRHHGPDDILEEPIPLAVDLNGMNLRPPTLINTTTSSSTTSTTTTS